MQPQEGGTSDHLCGGNRGIQRVSVDAADGLMVWVVAAYAVCSACRQAAHDAAQPVEWCRIVRLLPSIFPELMQHLLVWH